MDEVFFSSMLKQYIVMDFADCGCEQHLLPGAEHRKRTAFCMNWKKNVANGSRFLQFADRKSVAKAFVHGYNEKINDDMEMIF